MRYFEGFDQISYVTDNMARGMEVMQRDYDLPPFHLREVEGLATAGGVTGAIKLLVGISPFDGMKVELIQPIHDLGDLYSHRLAPDREAGLAFHHVGVRVRGDDPALWDKRFADLERRGRVYFTADFGPDIKFAYTDERPLLGHFVEHYWVRGQA